jgi:polar amino acid transport system permease protein
LTYVFNFGGLWPYWPQFLHGIGLTVVLTVVSVALGLVAGGLIAIGRRDGSRAVQRVCAVYIEIVRNTPFLVQIFIFYFGLASVGIQMPAAVAASLAMVINVGAYCAEILRAGMDSIAPGQIEAAQCLGLSKARTYWHVITPPALERVYPALTSQFVLMMLMTSVVSQISAEELTAVADNIQSATFLSFETYIVVAGIYVCLALLLKSCFWALGLLLFRRKRVLARAGRRAPQRVRSAA